MTVQDELTSSPRPAASGRNRPRRQRWQRQTNPPEESRLRNALMFLAVAAGVVVIWQLVCTLGDVNPVIVPKPTDVAEAMWEPLTVSPSSRLSYLPHVAQTMEEVLAGYAVGCSAGLLLAIASLYIRMFEILVRPFVVAFQSMPKIALAPLVVVWFGFGFESKFVLVTLATFFPLFVNGLVGLRSVDIGLIRMLRSFNASSFQMFRKVQFRAALPFIFAGMEIAVVHAVTSAVAAEFLGGQKGLGVRIIQSEQTLDVPSIFGVLILLALMGALLNLIIVQVRKRTVTWTGERLVYTDQ
ncbi:ABC transporter permease [Dactylosporangium sp. CA-092794]|uniref:ABC transporter permease n=1 Tax=Dactylosporangium sp. CA-092794 TaxID=3239929 RepID=UPI003D89C2C3